MRLHVDLDAEPWAFRHQEARRAHPALAEMEIVADRDPGDPEPPDQVMLNEILRRRSGPYFIEGHDDGTGEPGACEQAQLGDLVREPELWGGRAEEPARVWLEG